MLTLLTKTKVLWILFALFVLETLGFGIVMLIWDFTIIDEMSVPSHILDHIHHMNDTQKTVHIWMTATLDVVYPFTYGALFAGLSLRAFHPGFAVPAIAAILVDLAEGFVQVRLLTGAEELVWLKAYLTPAKLTLFFGAIIIAVAALAVSIRRHRALM